jgi:predicted site-specific integrase-resolvase
MPLAVHHLRDSHSERSGDLQGFSLCKYLEQNGGPTMIVGYARVSTDGQTLDAQRASLKAAGAEKVFAEKVSGAKTNRKELAKAIETLGAGDMLLVTRLDRLARSTRDLLNVLATVTRASNRWPMLGPTPLPHTDG